MTQEQITSMLENVERKDVEQLFKYLKMQKAENEALAKGKSQKEIVQEYLNALAKIDPELAAVYPANNAGKSIDDCYAYIEDNARKMRHDGKNCVSVTSFTVFEWAVTYFLDNNIAKFEVKKNTTAKTDYDPLPAKIKALQANKEKWQKENEKKVQDWETENNAKIDAFEKAHANDLFPAINPYTGQVNPHLNAVFPQQEELDKLLAEQKAKKEKAKETPDAEPAATAEEPAPEKEILPEEEDNNPDETGGELSFDEDNENDE